MILQFVVGFLVLVAGTYVGATMALRGFFGREYYDPRTGESVGTSNEPVGNSQGSADETDR